MNFSASLLRRYLVRIAFNIRYRDSVLLRSLQELERSQWLEPAEIGELQWRRTRDLIDHAYEHVPYYRGIMQERELKPAHFQGPADMAQLPILSKEIVRNNLRNLLAEGVNPHHLKETNTGGFTGKTATLYHDRRMVESYRAAKVRQFRWAGWQIGESWAKIWGSVADTSGRKTKLFNAVAGVQTLPAFCMSNATMLGYVEQLRRLQPPLIEAYATPLYVLARFLNSEGITDIRPRGIITSAERLYPHYREAIQKAFGCPVYDRYGCREVGDISQECAMGVKHINAENLLVEFLAGGRQAAPGETGHIVVTALQSHAMPLIRYQLGDVGSLRAGGCACGRGLPTMENAVGRATDGIVLRHNRMLPREYFPDVFKKYPVEKFQVVQKLEDRLLIRIVRGRNLTDDDVHRFDNEIRDFLRGEATVEYQFVEDIALTHSGKFQYTISEIPGDNGNGNGNH